MGPRTAAAAPNLRPDPGLPAASILLGEHAPEPLEAALAQAGGSLLAVQRGQVLYRPGQRITAEFDARVGLADGSARDVRLVAATGVEGPPDGSLVVERDDARVGVWRFPHDPLLPGLAEVMHHDGLRSLLDELGAPATEEVRASVLRYRPGRRAVVLVRSGGWSAYLKVMRPRRAAALADTSRRLSGHGAAVPPVIGVSERLGVLAMAPVQGRTIRNLLNEPGAALPGPEAVLEVLAQLERVEVDGPIREGAAREASDHGRLLAAVAPRSAARVERLLGELGQEDPPTGLRTVHGDLHDGQLVVRDAAIAGVIDLDRVGRGERADDLANMLAHLCVTGLGTSTASKRAVPYARALAERFALVEHPARLRRRTAAVVLGLATGPFRTQRPGWERETADLIGLAEKLLAGGVRLAT